MSHPILITGASGGQQGSTGRLIANLLLDEGVRVRAFVHKLDARSEELAGRGAEIVAGDLLDPAAVEEAMHDVERAYFTYPVAEGLLEASTIFAITARHAGVKLVVNNSQFQGAAGDPEFRSLYSAPSFRNLQHRLADRIFDGAGVGAVHIQAPPYYENLRAMVARSVQEQSSAFLPWGDGEAIIPLTGAADVARVAAVLLAGAGTPSETVYPLVTENLTVLEIFAALGKALGRPIRYVPITDEQWAEAVKDRINPHALTHLGHLWRYFRKNETQNRPTDTVRKVTGRDPQRLEEFFRTMTLPDAAGR